MIELLTSPWPWAYYVVTGIACVILAAREFGRMSLGVAVYFFLTGFYLTPLHAFDKARETLSDIAYWAVWKEIWRRK